MWHGPPILISFAFFSHFLHFSSSFSNKNRFFKKYLNKIQLSISYLQKKLWFHLNKFLFIIGLRTFEKEVAFTTTTTSRALELSPQTSMTVKELNLGSNRRMEKVNTFLQQNLYFKRGLYFGQSGDLTKLSETRSGA